MLLAMMLLALMAAALGVAQALTGAVGRRTGREAEFLRTEAAAEAGAEVMFGRLVKWVTANNGYGPSIADARTAGIPGNTAFPAITAQPTWPSGSGLNDYLYTFDLSPVLPDDTVITDPTNAAYLPNLSARASVSENTAGSVAARYFTHTTSSVAHSIPSNTMTYRATVTATPAAAASGVNSPGPVTVVRYLRCDKVSPFNWLSYQNGRKNGGGGTIYSGPLYVATDVVMSPVTFADSVLYGHSAAVGGDTWTGGGQASQLRQVTPFSIIPDLVNSLPTNGSGQRVASLETATAVDSTGSAPADRFSTRELIEPPTNPANDTTPANVKNRRIYNQADARVNIVATTIGSGKTAKTVLTPTVVGVDGSPVANTTWVPALLAAFVPKAADAAVPFVDRSRSTSTGVQVTDVNVGILRTVMNQYPDVFPTGIIYAWDSSAGSGSTLTGMRVWNAGVLPNVGLTFGTNDPVYLRGDFNTGTTLKDAVNPESGLGYQAKPASSDITQVNRAGSTTAAQRVVPGYDVKPGAVFGDSVTELSGAWLDRLSTNPAAAVSNTINLVEGWSTMNANERRPDDTYLDASGQANPVWIENWSQARRTMSGEEMVLWHCRYNLNCNQGTGGGGWQGDISYDRNVSALPLNWGSLAFVRDRYARR